MQQHHDKIVALEQPKAESRSDMIKTLQELLHLARKERVEMLEIYVKCGNKEFDRVHIDGAYWTK